MTYEFHCRYVFFMNALNPDASLEICVSKCPDKTLWTKQAVEDFSKATGSKLCCYDIDVDDYSEQEFSQEGPCPVLPVYAE